MTDSKSVLWLLILSFGVNVFLATLIGVHLFGGPPPMGRPLRPADVIEEMARNLPAADGQILKQAAEPYRAELERDDRPDERGFAVVDRALRADPFDPDAFRRALETQTQAHQRIGLVIDRVLLDAVPRFSAEGRRRMAEHRPPGRPEGPPPGPGR